jgi:predicted ABC-type ATPase
LTFALRLACSESSKGLHAQEAKTDAAPEANRDHRGTQRCGFETTLAARSYASYIPEWQKPGYRVKLIFLGLPSPEAAIASVRTRVLQGGHDVAEEVIRRRFEIGRRNFHQLYLNLVDDWDLYDNSGTVPKLIASGTNQ